MKRMFFLFIIGLCGYCFAGTLSKVTQITSIKSGKIYVLTNNHEYEATQVVTVKYLNIQQLQNGYNVIRHNKLFYADLNIPSNISLPQFISQLEADGNVIEIDYNSVGEYTSITPNDSHWDKMWHLAVTKVPQAWDITTGDHSLKVAVLDSGTDWTHPDLGIGSDSYQNIYCNLFEDDWTNKNNPTTGNHTDDDYNTLVDDYKGWNFDLGTNDSRGTFYHGTFVAGIVGAKTNNNCGIAGVAGGNYNPGVSIIPYCVGLQAPNTSIIDDAIIAAVDNGARVIQFSLSCSETNAIKAALQYAYNNEVAVVCASGNENSTVAFPASYYTVLAVGAMNKNNQRAPFSNYGSRLSVIAPGDSIYGLNLTTASQLYKYSSGTSFAAPQVSGIIALMLSTNPYLSLQEIIDIIESTAQKISPSIYSYTQTSTHPNGTWNDSVGYGLVDAYAAVKEANSKYIQGQDYICNTDTVQFYLRHPSQPGETVTWSVNGGPFSFLQEYFIVGSTHNDSVWVRRNSLNSGIGQQKPLVPPTISVTITNGTTSKTYTKEFRLPYTSSTPSFTASNTSSGWAAGTTRTFTITNCTDVPDYMFRWEVMKIVHYPAGTDTTYEDFDGRTLHYTPSIPVNVLGSITIKAINTKKECGTNWSSSSYGLYNPSILLTAQPEGNTLYINILEETEEELRSPAQLKQGADYSLELWHSLYGRMCTQVVQSTAEQINISGYPQGVYVLLLKENDNIIAQTKLIIQ